MLFLLLVLEDALLDDAAFLLLIVEDDVFVLLAEIEDVAFALLVPELVADEDAVLEVESSGLK